MVLIARLRTRVARLPLRELAAALLAVRCVRLIDGARLDVLDRDATSVS